MSRKRAMADHSDKTSEEVFCAGLPYVGNRRLEPDECLSLARRQRWLRLKGLFSSALSPICFISGLMFIVVNLDSAPPTGGVSNSLVAVGSLAVLAPTAIVYLIGREARSRAQGYRRARIFGYVRRFAGTAHMDDPTDRCLLALVRAKLIQPDSREHCELELLPLSNVVYSVNRVPIRKYVRLEVRTAAARPQDAVEFAVPSEWLPGEVPFEPQRRRQSRQETAEILRYWRSIKRKVWLSPLYFTLVCYCLYQLVRVAYPTAPVLLSAAAISLAGFLLFRNWQQARHVKADADLGWVMVVPPHTSTDKNGTDKEEERTLEVLPRSGAIWTIDGRPAGWRRKR
jgi:hypothetical protein